MCFPLLGNIILCRNGYFLIETIDVTEKKSFIIVYPCYFPGPNQVGITPFVKRSLK